MKENDYTKNLFCPGCDHTLESAAGIYQETYEQRDYKVIHAVCSNKSCTFTCTILVLDGKVVSTGLLSYMTDEAMEKLRQEISRYDWEPADNVKNPWDINVPKTAAWYSIQGSLLSTE